LYVPQQPAMANQEATEEAEVPVTMATYDLPVPEPIVCTRDASTNWKMFKEAYTDYAMAT